MPRLFICPMLRIEIMTNHLATNAKRAALWELLNQLEGFLHSEHVEDATQIDATLSLVRLIADHPEHAPVILKFDGKGYAHDKIRRCLETPVIA